MTYRDLCDFLLFFLLGAEFPPAPGRAAQGGQGVDLVHRLAFLPHCSGLQAWRIPSRLYPCETGAGYSDAGLMAYD